MRGWMIAVVAASMTLAACGEDGMPSAATADAGPYAAVAGRWERVYDPAQWAGGAVPRQRLQLDARGTFAIERIPASVPGTGGERTVEYGQLVPEGDGVAWRADSVETVTVMPDGRPSRTTLRGVTYIEGHEFGVSRLRRLTDRLLIEGRTAWIGSPFDFVATFRRL